MSPTARFKNAFSLSGSIARGGVGAAGAVVVAIAILLGRNQETGTHAVRIDNPHRAIAESGEEREKYGEAGFL
jgi:hypothetical protein